MDYERNDFKVIDKRLQDKDIQKYEPDPFLAMIERLAARPEVDPDKIQKFIDMQERILDRNAKQAFNAAMTKAQNKIELVVARSKNEQTRSMYAKLKQILIETKPIYTTEGFALMFYEGETLKENHTRVCVDIMHNEGHTEKRWGDFAVQTKGMAGNPMMTLIHGEGSAFSYGRRYLTCMIFNIPTGDDDDGNSAGGGVEKITKFEEWKIKFRETSEAAKTNEDIIKWWSNNGPSVKKELKKAEAAVVYDMVISRKKELQKREPGQEG